MTTLRPIKPYPSYFCDIFIRWYPILLFFSAETYLRKFETNTRVQNITCNIISFWFVVKM